MYRYKSGELKLRCPALMIPDILVYSTYNNIYVFYYLYSLPGFSVFSRHDPL